MTISGETWLVLNDASGSHDEERQQLPLEGLNRAGHAPVPLMVDGERRDGGLHEECMHAELAVDLLCIAHG